MLVSSLQFDITFSNMTRYIHQVVMVAIVIVVMWKPGRKIPTVNFIYMEASMIIKRYVCYLYSFSCCLWSISVYTVPNP